MSKTITDFFPLRATVLAGNLAAEHPIEQCPAWEALHSFITYLLDHSLGHRRMAIPGKEYQSFEVSFNCLGPENFSWFDTDPHAPFSSFTATLIRIEEFGNQTIYELTPGPGYEAFKQRHSDVLIEPFKHHVSSSGFFTGNKSDEWVLSTLLAMAEPFITEFMLDDLLDGYPESELFEITQKIQQRKASIEPLVQQMRIPQLR